MAKSKQKAIELLATSYWLRWRMISAWMLLCQSKTPANNRLHLTGGGLPAIQSSFTAEGIPPAKLPAKSPRR